MLKKKLTILVSHPIQYQVPFFKKLAAEPGIDLQVYFCWNFGVKNTYDKQFGHSLKWDIPVLDGYSSKFLKNFSLKPSSDFFGQINPGIVKEIIKNKHNAILIYGWNSFTNWLAFFTAFLTKTPVFLQGENPLNHEIAKNKIKLIFKKIIIGGLFRKISAFLYIGSENKKFYKFYGVPEDKLFFAPYAVDNERFIKTANEISKKNARLKLNLPDSDFIILFVGKLIEKKNPLDLLRSYEKIKNPAKKLIFVGNGHLRRSLEKYVADNEIQNVVFTGFQNQTELPFYYAAADVFVLPSGIGETWGLVVNEAMCFSLPVIVSDIVGCGPDLVQTGKNGSIFPCGHVEKLAECINVLASDGEIQKQYGEKSLEIVKNYNYEKVINTIVIILKK